MIVALWKFVFRLFRIGILFFGSIVLANHIKIVGTEIVPVSVFLPHFIIFSASLIWHGIHLHLESLPQMEKEYTSALGKEAGACM